MWLLYKQVAQFCKQNCATCLRTNIMLCELFTQFKYYFNFVISEFLKMHPNGFCYGRPLNSNFHRSQN